MATNRLTLWLEAKVRGLQSIKAMSNATLGLQAASRNAKARVEGSFIDLERKLETISSRIVKRTISIRTAILALVAGGLVKKTTDFAGEFEHALGLVNTILGDSAQSIDKYRTSLIELSKTSPTGLVDSAKALYEIVGGGISTLAGAEKATETLAAAQKAAAASTATVAQSADAIVSILNAYGSTGITAAEVTDKLFRTVDKGRISFQELAATIGNITGTAAAYGVSLDEVLATTATLSRVTGPEEAVTSVGRLMDLLAKPTNKESRGLFKSLGIDASAAGLATNGLVGTLRQLHTAIAGDGDLIAKLFPNVRARRGVTVLLGDQFESLIEIAGTDLPKAFGAVDEATAIMAKTMAYQLGLVRNAWERSLLLIGTEVGPIVVKALQGLVVFLETNQDKVSGFFLGLIDAASGIAHFFVEIAPAIGAAVTLVVAFGKALAYIVAALGPDLIKLGTSLVIGWGFMELWKGVKLFITGLKEAGAARAAVAATAAKDAADEIKAAKSTQAALAGTITAIKDKEAATIAAAKAQITAAQLKLTGDVVGKDPARVIKDAALQIKNTEAAAAATRAAANTQIAAIQAKQAAVSEAAKAEVAAARTVRAEAIAAAGVAAKAQAAAGVAAATIKIDKTAAIEAARATANTQIAATQKAAAATTAAATKEIAALEAKAVAAERAAAKQIAASNAVIASQQKLLLAPVSASGRSAAVTAAAEITAAESAIIKAQAESAKRIRIAQVTAAIEGNNAYAKAAAQGGTFAAASFGGSLIAGLEGILGKVGDLILSSVGGWPGLIIAGLGALVIFWDDLAGVANATFKTIQAEMEATKQRAKTLIDVLDTLARLTGSTDFAGAREKSVLGAETNTDLGMVKARGSKGNTPEEIQFEVLERIGELQKKSFDLAKAANDQRAEAAVLTDAIAKSEDEFARNVKWDIEGRDASLKKQREQRDEVLRGAAANDEWAATAWNTSAAMDAQVAHLMAATQKDAEMLARAKSGYLLLIEDDKARIEAIKQGLSVVTAQEIKEAKERNKAIGESLEIWAKANTEIAKIQKEAAGDAADAGFGIIESDLQARLALAEANGQKTIEIEKEIVDVGLAHALEAINTKEEAQIAAIKATGFESARTEAEIAELGKKFTIVREAELATAAVKRLGIELKHAADIKGLLDASKKDQDDAEFGIIEQNLEQRLILAKKGSEEERRIRVAQIHVWYTKELEAIEALNAARKKGLSAETESTQASWQLEQSYITQTTNAAEELETKLASLNKDLAKGTKKAFVDTIGAIRGLIKDIVVANLGAAVDAAQRRIAALDAAGLGGTKMRAEAETQALNADIAAKRFALEIDLQQRRDSLKREHADKRILALEERKAADDADIARGRLTEEGLRRRREIAAVEIAGARAAALARERASIERDQATTGTTISALEEQAIDAGRAVALAEEETSNGLLAFDLDRIKRVGQAELDIQREIADAKSVGIALAADLEINGILEAGNERIALLKAAKATSQDTTAIDAEIVAVREAAEEKIARVRRGAVAEDAANAADTARKITDLAAKLEKAAANFRTALFDAAAALGNAISSSFEQMDKARQQGEKSIAKATTESKTANIKSRKADQAVITAQARVDAARARLTKAEQAITTAGHRRDTAVARGSGVNPAESSIVEAQAAAEAAKAALDAAISRKKEVEETAKAAGLDRKTKAADVKAARAEAKTAAEEAAPKVEDVTDMIGMLGPELGKKIGLSLGLGEFATLLGPITGLLVNAPNILRGAGTFVSAVFNDFVNRFLDIPAAFATFMAKGVPLIITSVIARIPEIIQGFIDMMPAINAAIIDAIPGIAKALAKAVYEMLEKVLGRFTTKKGWKQNAEDLADLTTFGGYSALKKWAGFGHEGGIMGRDGFQRFQSGGMAIGRRLGDTIPAMLRQGEGVLTPERGVPAIGGEDAVMRANHGIPPTGQGTTVVSINANDAGVQALLAMIVRDVAVSVTTPFGTVRRAIRANREGGPPPMQKQVARGVL